jgi:hypothetical protein
MLVGGFKAVTRNQALKRNLVEEAKYASLGQLSESC